ncbi:MAG: enoyl-CoA hydratase/isomerase family protein, partial [Rhodoferax sp.]|nr:enoyl-CoA hydratase/isomerase family protein [Rhodoferax sp.]
RFFHQAALAGDTALDTFFTVEDTLNHLIHSYPKPYIAFMDGIVMGGGMGISQGGSLRIVTEKTKMAMPETGIGLFPDVGGGYFLGRCPGNVGEYLALIGDTIGGDQAVAWGLADVCVPSGDLPVLWSALQTCGSAGGLQQWIAEHLMHQYPRSAAPVVGLEPALEAAFGLDTVTQIVSALEALGTKPARAITKTLRQRSPLMLHVVLAQIRRGRGMSLADNLRMERDMVQHCFYTHHLGRTGAASETVEGIRALAIDKDYQPRWNPARIDAVTMDMVEPFFESPWTAGAHPLRELV